ncbi:MULTISPECIES: transporter substrate-binding domain-containing protein [unclassified Agarivorans]|uniref:transporter substrate-binding domain-containing protein n=1 Tax=unclassified Agarivorans TaxID=2636026 RepID=UPI003D7D9958
MRCKFLLFLSLILIHFAQAEELPLRVVTEASYPPFESFDQNKQLVGFDIDLAKALCMQMKRECQFYHQPFDSLLGSVAVGHYDFAISALDITEPRQRLVNFSHAYFDNIAVYITKAEYKLTSQSVVAVQNGSSFQRFLRRQRKAIFSISYPSYQLALQDLLQDRIDAVLLDSAAAHYWLVKHPQYVLQTDRTYPASGLGIAVSKQDQRLLQKINDALKVLKSNGEYQAIYQAYFK